VLYNGKDPCPDETVLKLSGAFRDPGLKVEAPGGVQLFPA
jgi:hypothetical protein